LCLGLELGLCATGKERRITRWEHEHVLEKVQKRLDKNHATARETAEHPFATLKMSMGATQFLMKRLPKVATEMALHVLAYIMGVDDRQKLQAMQLAGDAIQLVQF